MNRPDRTEDSARGAVDPAIDRKVRYQVLFAACTLAVLGYLHRVSFKTAAPVLGGSLGLTVDDLSYLMAAFMVAYGLSEVPFGMIGDQFGARNLLVVLVVGWSFLTGAIAWVGWLPVQTIWPLVYLLALRFAFGLFQGGMFPAITRMMTDWMPTTERGMAQGFIWMSSRMGGALAPWIVVGLFRRFQVGPVAFWTLASVGGFWCVLFWPWYRDRPADKAGVTPAELARIRFGRSDAAPAGHAGMPWRKALRSRNVWSLCLMYGCIGFTGNFFITMLDAYLLKYRALPLNTVAWLSSLPLAGGVVACVLGGTLSDVLVRRTGSLRWGRRAVGVFGLTLAAVALLGTIGTRNPVWLGVLLCATFFGNDLAMGPAWAACGDIGERSAATLGGAMNMLGSFTGAAGALLIGFLLRHGYETLLFVILAGVYALGACLWLGVDATRTLGAED